jgi:ADP-ribosylglycohydrolase
MDLRERFTGTILGLAIGDALGHPTEFMGIESIRARWGAEGVTRFEPAGRHPAGTFTDDTQMSIAVARALVRAGRQPVDDLMAVMAEEFMNWSVSAENNRAPGGACMSGCSSLRRGVAWRRAGVADSKGCGAAMRAAPIGLFYASDLDRLVEVAAAQTALTHRHPTAFASAVAAAAGVAWLVREHPLDGLLGFVVECVERVSDPLLESMGCEPRLIERYGRREMLEALEKTAEVLDRESDDVCRLLGGAWIGEEAVACALWCVLRARGDFRETVLRGANSSGDSDSIACIAGSFAGAHGGTHAIAREWAEDVEQSARLEALASALHAVATGGEEMRELGPELAFFSERSEAM